ncbi:MAG: anaerobic sulfite reductase subunit AsrA [Eubacteriales bacterium]|nr:anaerobic sulfite reductase subunit AsrA [Eubacteriales bacterium]
MGYQLSKADANALFADLSEQYDIWAPVLKTGEGCFSDTDIVRYDKVKSVDEIVWDKKSDYSFKETLLHINETLFYFTEDETTVPKGPEKELLIFMRACDFHALKRLDQIYLDNKFEDFYYKRIREKAKFALIGCSESCKSGFCVSMGTNQTDEYAIYVAVNGDTVSIDVKDESFKNTITYGRYTTEVEVTPAFVTENYEKVTLPKKLSNESFTNEIWKEYGERCITCGRCNFACPTCTCFTMQDIFYHDNPKVGERRRVWASCQIEDYDQIAGGIKFRKTKADNMRFKVMHKIYDYEKRFGYPMCVGCGRCDDICPEYISYSALVNRLAKEEQ